MILVQTSFSFLSSCDSPKWAETECICSSLRILLRSAWDWSSSAFLMGSLLVLLRLVIRWLEKSRSSSPRCRSSLHSSPNSWVRALLTLDTVTDCRLSPTASLPFNTWGVFSRTKLGDLPSSCWIFNNDCFICLSLAAGNLPSFNGVTIGRLQSADMIGVSVMDGSGSDLVNRLLWLAFSQTAGAVNVPVDGTHRDLFRERLLFGSEGWCIAPLCSLEAAKAASLCLQIFVTEVPGGRNKELETLIPFLSSVSNSSSDEQRLTSSMLLSPQISEFCKAEWTGMPGGDAVGILMTTGVDERGWVLLWIGIRSGKWNWFLLFGWTDSIVCSDHALVMSGRSPGGDLVLTAIKFCWLNAASVLVLHRPIKMNGWSMEECVEAKETLHVDGRLAMLRCTNGCNRVVWLRSLGRLHHSISSGFNRSMTTRAGIHCSSSSRALALSPVHKHSSKNQKNQKFSLFNYCCFFKNNYQWLLFSFVLFCHKY